MLIHRAHIYIFGIPNHHRLMPCTRFLGVKRLPAEKVLKHPVIVGSSGYFQEMLFYMTDQLNLTMVTKDVNKEEINGTSILKFQETEKLMPCEIMLKLHLADVCSGGVPIKGPWIGVNDTQDLTIAIQRQPNTLIAGLPKGNAPGMPFSAVMSFTSVT